MPKFMVLRTVVERYEVEAASEADVAKMFAHDPQIREKLVDTDPADVPLVIEPLYEEQGG